VQMRHNVIYLRTNDYFVLLYSLAKSSDYFYGDTSLWLFKKIKKLKKRSIVSYTWTLRHSLLIFRGTIFEWGIDDSYYMRRTPRDCDISWSWRRKNHLYLCIKAITRRCCCWQFG
jgi:hypothetical protein